MADRRRMGGAVLGMLAVSALTGTLAGCSGASSSGSTSAPAAATLASPAGQGKVLESSRHASAGGTGQPVAVADIAPAKLPAEVIQTADVRLQVSHGRVSRAITGIRALALRSGGYVSRSAVSGTSARTGSIVVRIPQARFTRALGGIEGFGRVISETDAGHDVTAQFIDLSARLVNMRDQENFLRRLMARAGTVRGSIEIEGQLTQVQLGVEQITGQLRYLRNRSDFSTISVQVSEAGVKPPPAHHHASSLWKAGARSLRAALSVVSAVIVGAGYTIPIALLGLIGLGAARLLLPRLGRPAAASGGTPEA